MHAARELERTDAHREVPGARDGAGQRAYPLRWPGISPDFEPAGQLAIAGARFRERSVEPFVLSGEVIP